MTTFSLFTQYMISGITAGSIYAMVGICWSVVYLLSQVLNFMTGEFVMLGGMLTWVFVEAGLRIPIAAVLAVCCSVVLAIILDRFVIRPVKYPSEIIYMVVTIASASVVKGVFLLSFGSQTHTIEPFIRAMPFHVFGASLTPQVLCIITALALIAGGLFLFVSRTFFGKALKASASNVNGARLIGIDIHRFRLFGFGLAGAIGAIAGVVITPITFTGYSVGLMTGIKGLVAAMIGGWSILGTVIAGLIIGQLEGLSAGFISPGWKDAFTLSVMVVFLIGRTISFPAFKAER